MVTLKVIATVTIQNSSSKIRTQTRTHTHTDTHPSRAPPLPESYRKTMNSQTDIVHVLKAHTVLRLRSAPILNEAWQVAAELARKER